MIKKTVVAVAVSALVCGVWVSSASAKHRPHHKNMRMGHHMHMAPAKKDTAMKTMPGNNPMVSSPSSASKTVSNYPAPKAAVGNNPMGVAKPK
jgi:hypothetical protein